MKMVLRTLSAFVIASCSATPVLCAGADDVKAAYEQWNDAFNKGDAPKIASSYTEDAIFLPPTHEVIEGQSGIQSFFDGLLKNGVTDHQLQVISVMEDGDEVVAASKWSAKGGDGSTLGGIATHVFRKQEDGSLKLKLHTFN